MSGSPDTSCRASEDRPPVAMPRVGAVTGWWLACLVLAVVGLAPRRDLLVDLTSGQVWQGLMWGSASVAVWMLASPPSLAGRRVLAVGILTVLFWWFHHCSGRPMSRYVVSVGSFAFLQLAVGPMVGWPGWSFGTQTLHSVQRYRFGIGGLMLLTAAIAIVLAATRAYEAPETLFHGSRVSAVGMVMIALAAQRSMLSRRHATLWAIATLVSVGVTMALLGTLHVLQMKSFQQPPQVETGVGDLFDAAAWGYYLLPLLSFTTVVAATGMCGRLDHEIERAKRQSRARLAGTRMNRISSAPAQSYKS